MEEVTVEENELGLRLFVNGTPDLRLMQKDIWESFLVAMEQDIDGHYKKKPKTRSRCTETRTPKYKSGDGKS